jgi:hypothetical protein
MAEELIPRLEDLGDYPLIRVSPSVRAVLGGESQPWSVPTDFVPQWVATHGGDKELAQDHWERQVHDIGWTDAVERHLTGGKATRQAVTAAVILLAHPNAPYCCEFCPAPERADQTLDVNDAEPQTANEGSAP